MIIREVEKPKIKELTKYKKSWPMRSDNILDGVQLTGSGKGAITLILNYLSEKGVIKNKLDEVIIADWIGYWVYNQIQPFAFPAKSLSPKSKAIIVYHQYGFPQKIDEIMYFAKSKNLILIEDCAHCIDSYYKGKQAGTFGDFTLYSYSKWFSCFALGGVKSKFEDFNKFVEKEFNKTPMGVTFFKDFSKIIYEYSAFSNSSLFKRYASLLLNMSYSIYGDALSPSKLAVKMLYSKLDSEIKTRRERYSLLLREVDNFGICDYLERKDIITPYVIPIFCSEKNKKIVDVFKSNGIVTGIYNFDVNRNLLSPKFIECVWVPCHGGISDENFYKIIGLIKKNL
jgi:hypothetical protein